MCDINPSNWSTYHNLDQISQCEKTIFYGLNDTKSASERWEHQDAKHTWQDLIDNWKKYSEHNHGPKDKTFSAYLASLVGASPGAQCGESGKNDCNEMTDCNGDDRNIHSGPARVLVWNSLVQISNVCICDLLSFFIFFCRSLMADDLS